MPTLSLKRRRTENSRSCRRGSLLTGCLIVLAIVVVLVVVGGVYVGTHWRGWMADVTVGVATQVLNASELSDDQKQQIIGEIEQLASDFKAKKISLEELVKVATAIGESPLLPVVAVMAADKQYLDSSGLSDEEKADARLQFQRMARAVHEKKISRDEAFQSMDEIMVRTNNNWQLRDRETVDDDDLRQLAVELKAATDEAGIPNEPFEIDFAAEFTKAINEALGRAPAALPEPDADEPVEGDQEPGEEEGGDEPGEGGGG